MVSRAISAGIKAGARPLPEHAQISCISCIKRTVAIAEATDEGTACLFTQNVAHWLTAFSTIIARPCETPPKKWLPALINSFDENWLAVGGGDHGVTSGGGD